MGNISEITHPTRQPDATEPPCADAARPAGGAADAAAARTGTDGGNSSSPRAASHPEDDGTPVPVRPLPLLTIAALDVVYGDIGTSPLYAIRECFFGSHAVPPTPANVLGILSLILYSLVLVVSLKYIAIVMRADNQGEGGILALTSLLAGAGDRRRPRPLVLLGIFGAALLYSDGMITPPITVLGAVEGLNVATSIFAPYVVPLAVVLLIALFSIQQHGAGGWVGCSAPSWASGSPRWLRSGSNGSPTCPKCCAR